MNQKIHYYRISIYILFILLLPYSCHFNTTTYIKAQSNSSHIWTENSYSSRYGYSKLTKQEKRVYLYLLKTLDKFHHSSTNVKKYDPEANEYILHTYNVKKYALTPKSVLKAYASICYDNPQYFWLGYTYRYTYEKSGTRTFTINIPTEYASASRRKKVWAKIQKKIKQCLNQSKNYTSIFDKEKFFHDWIIRSINYAPDEKSQYAPWSHSIEGVFSRKSAVCEGYAKAFQLLLNASGIENVYVAGSSMGQTHAWNLVNLGSNENKRWYQVDTTWDDLGGSENLNDYSYSNYVTYEFFNCTKGHFGDHKCSTPKSKEYLYPLPTCTTSEKYNYYHCRNSYATENNIKNLNLTAQFFADAITTAIENNESYVYIAAKNESTLNALYKFYSSHSDLILACIPDTNPVKEKISGVPFHSQPYNVVFCIPLTLEN